MSDPRAGAVHWGEGPNARPALAKGVSDIQQLHDELMVGFESRADLIRWGQRAVVRFVGELSVDWWHQLADSFIPGSNDRHRLLHDALLDDMSDTPLPQEYARSYREVIRRKRLIPAASRAIDWLSDQATTMPDEAQMNPEEQAYPAMQIELASIESYQATAVDAALSGPIADDQLSGWATVCQLGANGNHILPANVREGIHTGDTFAQALENEPVLRHAFTATDPSIRDVRLRELVIVRWLLPAWTRGVRDARQSGSEVPHQDSDKSLSFDRSG